MSQTKSNQGVILIVEDESDLRDLLVLVLGRLTPNLLVAENGKVALNLIQSREVHAVISDISMPEMNGIELLGEVRKLGLDLPFVFATAFGDKNNLLDALRLGAFDFIEKPFANKLIYAVMEKVLELGLAFKAAEAEIDAMYFDTRFNSIDVVRLKNMRRASLLMKLECDIYTRRRAI